MTAIHWLAWTIGVLIAVYGLLMIVSRGDRRALIRWDHSLPFHNKRWQRWGPDALIMRWARRVFPAPFFYNPDTVKEGKLRHWCRKLGPTMLAAPWRRLRTLPDPMLWHQCGGEGIAQRIGHCDRGGERERGSPHVGVIHQVNDRRSLHSHIGGG